ncbi:hypothetical protein ON010_g662 [Phytophthora cinnamomi]|nr:hypothetical protein ON010_g662 [Phytophthora cinnamomi]
MTTLSDAESPQVLDTGDTSHEHDDNSNTAAASPTPAASQHVEEKNHTPVVFPKSTILRGSRRHSSQMPSGVVHPVAKGADEVTNRARKRSVSTRGIAGTPSSSVPAWATLSSGLRRSVSDMHAHSELTNRRRTTESPYEEMMERFQIRQLQRTPSNMTTGLEDLLAGDFGAASSARTARTPRLEHYLLPRLSARNVNEQAPANDAGSRKASFLHLSDGSGINGLPIGRPPLESGTSSLQLTEQYNLTYGTLNHPPYRPSRWEYVLGMISGGKWVSAMLDVLSVERSAHIMRVIRMIWLVRANQSASGHNNIWAWLLYSRYSHLFRIAGAVAILVCIGHYIACIWTILLKGDETSDEAYESWRDVYSANFYAALLLFQGEGVPTDTAAQNMFAALSVIVGAIVLAVMFGQVAVLVSNFNANTTSYQRKMEEVFAMTTKLQLPPPLRERIREYYEHLWHEYECLDGEIVQFSKELSHTLGLEVVLFKYMEVVMHVPFWKDCTPDFQKQLMLRLDVRVYLPNDFIMREGEVDVEFYMVNRGYCEIGRENNRFERVTATTIAARRSTGGGFSLGRNNSGMGPRHRNGPANGDQSDDGTRQSVYELDAAQRRYYRAGGRGGKGHDVLISRGQAFGDMALLMNYQRAANVRAITHVEMCVLSREDFQIVLARYPEDRRRVVVDMLASYMQTYELCKSRCPLLELVRKVYSPEAIAEACAKSGGHPPLLPPVLSARQAAERIYMAMNVETNDGTLKFGVGVNIRDELVDLREKLRKRREPKQQPKANSVAPRTPSSSDRTNSKSRRGSDERMRTCSTCGKSQIVEPVQCSAGGKAVHESPQTTLSPSLLARLKQAEEREIAIVQALQDLKGSLKLLQARQMAPVISPTRKRSEPGDDSAISTRAPLVERMGSFVGLASGSTSKSKPTGGQTSKRSPTRYADELFSQGSSTASERSNTHDRLHPTRRLLQPISRKEASFTFSSEIESHRSTVETPLLDQPPTAAPTPPAHAGYKLSDLQRASSKSLTSAPTEENDQRMLFQRMPSQSMTKLQGASRARTGSGPATKPVADDQARRSNFRRTHSQSMRALTEALAAHAPPRASLSNAQARVLKRMSSFVSDSSGSLTGERSPTRYADALFRRKSIELAKDEDWESGKPIAMLRPLMSTAALEGVRRAPRYVYNTTGVKFGAQARLKDAVVHFVRAQKVVQLVRWHRQVERGHLANAGFVKALQVAVIVDVRRQQLHAAGHVGVSAVVKTSRIHNVVLRVVESDELFLGGGKRFKHVLRVLVRRLRVQLAVQQQHTDVCWEGCSLVPILITLVEDPVALVAASLNASQAADFSFEKAQYVDARP